MTDEQVKQMYYQSQGLNCYSDVGREFYKKQVKKIWKSKGYKVDKANRMPKHQLKAIYNS